MRPLDVDYKSEVDLLDKISWHTLVKEFDDATFYQTWSYGEKLWGAKNLSHFVLLYKDRVVSIAQLRILQFPLLKTGVAYLNWGPLWKGQGGEDRNEAHYRNMLRALRNEYVHKRNYALRILPKIFDTPEYSSMKKIFAEEKFVYSPESLRTFVVDLRPPLEDLRKNLHKSWRQSLSFAEKQGLRIVEATGPKHYAATVAINKQMKARKNFIGTDNEEILIVNADLPKDLRLKVLLCEYQDEIVAALGWSNIGKVCFPIVGGTGEKALQYKASFLLYWEMIKDCRARGFEYCDTAGVHEKRNPGGYFFKKGVAGKNAREMTYLGQFDAFKSYPTFMLFKAGMAVRERAYNAARKVRINFYRRNRETSPMNFLLNKWIFSIRRLQTVYVFDKSL